MCNNDNLKPQTYGCTVTVLSQGDGWKDERKTDGTFTFDGKEVRLEYTLDGDKCLLTVNGHFVTQERTGVNNISLAFCEGERTECVFGNGNLKGSFEIFTEEIKLKIEETCFRLSLIYESGGSEKINLTLTAEKNGG